MILIILLLISSLYSSSQTDKMKMSCFEESIKVGVNPYLSLSIVEVESNWKHKVKGDGGESHGLFQIKCETAKLIGYKGNCEGLLIPKVNIKYGVKYLKIQLDKYGTLEGIAAYNSGKPYYKKNGELINSKYVAKVLTALLKYKNLNIIVALN